MVDTESPAMDKYFELLHELQRKQVLERMLFEIEAYFDVFKENGLLGIKELINECASSEAFKESEYLELVKKSLKKYNSDHLSKLTSNKKSIFLN